MKGLFFLKDFKQKSFLRDSLLFKPNVQLTERIAALFWGVEMTWNVERPILPRKNRITNRPHALRSQWLESLPHETILKAVLIMERKVSFPYNFIYVINLLQSPVALGAETGTKE